VSKLEGRIYEVRLPDSSVLTVDPLLTQVKITAKQSIVGTAHGLCQDQQQVEPATTSCDGNTDDCHLETWRWEIIKIFKYYYTWVHGHHCMWHLPVQGNPKRAKNPEFFEVSLLHCIVYYQTNRLRPSRKFLEKFKIIFFTNFSRNYFREIREVIFLEFLYFDFIPHVFRVRWQV
jgi:hypothetical protein